MNGKVTVHEPLPIQQVIGPRWGGPPGVTQRAVECIVHGRFVFPPDSVEVHDAAKAHAACAHMESRRIRGRRTPPPRKSRSRA